jgi:hypothetical protein
MRIFLLILLLSGCVKAEPIAVIGDSLTSVIYSWANVISTPEQPLYIMAQPGRTIRDYEIPRDWVAFHYSHVIYFIGTNDILAELNILKTRRIFRHHIRFMIDRNFKPIVILPPVYDKAKENSLAIRKMMRNTSDNHAVPIIDLANVWDSSWTRDGVHPTEQGHMILAYYIRERLEGIL